MSQSLHEVARELINMILNDPITTVEIIYDHSAGIWKHRHSGRIVSKALKLEEALNQEDQSIYAEVAQKTSAPVVANAGTAGRVERPVLNRDDSGETRQTLAPFQDDATMRFSLLELE